MANEWWSVAEAKRYAVICRKHGLRCRVVLCKKTESYLAVYHSAEDQQFAANPPCGQS